MESYAKGDRVSLKEPLGPITTGEMGVIVEVYGENETPDGEVIGTKDFDLYGGATLFDYGVVFNSLRAASRTREQMPWNTEKVDLSQFSLSMGGLNTGPLNIIPVAHDELNFIDSDLREVMA